jgi:hypothetical protein
MIKFNIVTIALLAGNAYATGNPPTNGHSKQNQGQQQHQTNSQQQQQGLTSNQTQQFAPTNNVGPSTGGSLTTGDIVTGPSTSSATGGNSESKAKSDSSSSGNSSDVDSKMWVLPAPVFSIPPVMTCVLGNASSNAFAIGWNFVSIASSNSSGDNCLTVELRNAKVATCQFEDARQIENLLLQKLLPEFKSTAPVSVNLTYQECHLLRDAGQNAKRETSQFNLLPKDQVQTVVVNVSVVEVEEKSDPPKAPKRQPKLKKCKDDEKLVEMCVPKEKK